MERRWRHLCLVFLFSLTGGYFAAAWIAPQILPTAGAPRVVEPYGDWITLDEPAHQAYFRRIIDVPFRPQHAWIAVASEDFALWVNGKRMISNRHVLNAALPLHDQLSDPLQGLNIEFPIMARSPEIRRGPNLEHSTVQFVDVSQLLQRGTNILGIELQSATPNPTFLLMGEIAGEHQTLKISGEADQWRVSSIPRPIGTEPWQVSQRLNDGWRVAKKASLAPESLFAVVAPEIWSMPLPHLALSEPDLGGEIRFGRRITGLTWHGAQDGAWLRIASSWPYSLFVDGVLVASRQASGNTDVHDITAFLTRPESWIALRLAPPPLTVGQRAAPLVVIDGVVDGLPLDPVTGWRVLDGEHAQWLEGRGHWRTAIVTRIADNQALISLQSRSKPDGWTGRFLALWLMMSTAIFMLVMIVATTIRVSGRWMPQPSGAAMAALGLPILTIVALVLLRLRYKESDTIFWFIDPRNRFICASIIVTSLGMAFAWLASASPSRLSQPALSRSPSLSPVVTQMLLLAIVCLGFWLRAQGLSLEDLQADENVSFDAARGILRSGAPEAVSGILYTRSPLYHYLLAIWMWAFGDTPELARSFSVVTGTAVIMAVYHFARLMGANRAIALLVCLWIAVDPWQITVSRNIRFYQQMQLCGLLSFIFFLKGFILGRDKPAQMKFFIFATAAILSQEVFVIVLPGLCIAGYLYYRPFDLHNDRLILIGAAASLGITAIDLITFQLLCLTPHVGVATTSGSILQLHALNINAFASTFFSGPLRAHFMATVAFGVGLMTWSYFRRPSLAFGYIVVISTVVVASALVVQVANRYLFVVYPVFIAVGVLGLRDLVLLSAETLLPGEIWLRHRQRWIGLVSTVLIIAGVGSSEFWRTLDSYDQLTIPQHETAYRFIGDQWQSGDVVISVSPMAGAIVLGGIDYYLMELISFDEVYQSRGRGILDRWAGGQLVSNIDLLRNVFIKHKRVWVVMDQPEARKMSSEILRYIDAMTSPQLAFFGGEVRLWSQADGQHAHSPDLGRGGTTY